MNRVKIAKHVIEVLNSRMTIPRDMFKIEEETKFTDLGFDSLDMLEVAFFLEEDFDININISDLRDVVTVADLVDYISAQKGIIK